MSALPWRLLLVALVLGALHALSFAPWPAWWLQLLCLSGLMRLVLSVASQSVRGRTLIVFTFGLGHYVAGLCWLTISMHRYGGMPALLAGLAVLLFAAYLSAFSSLALALTRPPPTPDRTGSTRPILIAGVVFAGTTAGAWTLAELARGWLFTGFPWLSTGYAHVDGPLGLLAPLVGVYGVGLAAAWIAALLALAMRPGPPRPRLTWAALAIITLAACLPLRGVEYTQARGAPVTVRLVQGNVAQQLKFDPQHSFNAMQRYAQAIAQSPATLTVLPETAWTSPWTSTPDTVRETILESLRGSGRAVAVGMPLVEGVGAAMRITNSVLLLAERAPATAGPVARYDKHHLVPFGEFIPWGFDWFVRLMQIPLGSFARGDLAQAPFEVNSQRFAINICYEDLFGEEIIEAIRPPANASVLVNVSNIAWFGDSHALPQHLEIARMRSLETGRPMLRATNTGVTASIDHRGRVLSRLPHEREGVLDVSVQGTGGLTPYTRTGNLPVIMLALGLVVLGWQWSRRQAAFQ